MVQSFQDLHLPPHALLVPLDFLLRDDLQRDFLRYAAERAVPEAGRRWPRHAFRGAQVPLRAARR